MDERSRFLSIIKIKKNSNLFQAKVVGPSMEPVIFEDDIVTIDPSPCGALMKDDIIVFIHPTLNHLVVHRIVKIDGNQYWVKGDNNSFCDGFLYRNQIIGRVCQIHSTNNKKCSTVNR